MSQSWRYVWLLIGLVGLLVLINWPEAAEDRSAGRDSISAPKERLADHLARVAALQKPWLDALWMPEPSVLVQVLAASLNPNSELDELQNRPLHLLFIGQGCHRHQRPTPAATLTALKLLLAAGADPNALDRLGNTPLMLAVAHCDAPVIAQLIAAGADPNRVNSRGLTAFEMTLSNPGDAALALLAAGFRLEPEKLQRYSALYADEPQVMALLKAAATKPGQP